MSRDTTEAMKEAKKYWKFVGEMLMIFNTALALAIIIILWIVNGG